MWDKPNVKDIVWCYFPTRERRDIPSNKPRLVLVTADYGENNGIHYFQVAYGTSQNTADLYSGEFVIRKAEKDAFLAAGLIKDTKFDLRNTVIIPWVEEYFAPHNHWRPLGETPKIGYLHESVEKKLRAAIMAVKR